MNNQFYSDKDFYKMKERINKEILSRGTFKWWNPLTSPSVGADKDNPIALHNKEYPTRVDDETYTINNPSINSIERTRNSIYEAHGDNPGGNKDEVSSATEVNIDEMKNFLVGLAKIHDINLFYGRDETVLLAFRDPNGIEEVLSNAENDVLNVPLKESPILGNKVDPNNGEIHHQIKNYPQYKEVEYPIENGQYVMPSGEFDGEELESIDGIGPSNFFDDYGAEPGNGHYHPWNPHISPYQTRNWNDQGNKRKDPPTINLIGGIPAMIYGKNPRNPVQGNPLKSRPVYGGTPGTCQVACTGECHVTCDNECSESCTNTCFDRCGQACTSSCGNVCTGCSNMCLNTCKTKCENSSGYACVKAGAKTVKITTIGGTNGVPAQNVLSYTTYTCTGCSYSCQFYPNKKTECWDAACMNQCFTSCKNACSTSCFGGCINNPKHGDSKDYKKGLGQGCSANCTLNCIGGCLGVCEGICVFNCYMACKQQCTDNCSFECTTYCGNGCDFSCKGACTGCTSCVGSCISNARSNTSHGCATEGGCTSECKNDCNHSCLGIGCRSICGSEAGGSCEANCRLSCTGTSCTSQCSDECSSQCTTCINTCGFQCGTCSSQCSTGCEAACNITCTDECKHSCSLNCVQSCTEECGSCSTLCYSCVGMCIGICSVRCENTCSSCANNCSWWCDTQCNQRCFGNCDSFCINSCVGSCISYLMSETLTSLKGPEQDPTSEGYIYPHPKNRWEERESFKLIRDIAPYHPRKEIPNYLIFIDFDDQKNLRFNIPKGLKYVIRQSTLHGGVYSIDEDTGETTINWGMVYNLPITENPPNFDNDHAIIVIQFFYNENIQYELSVIGLKLPFGFYYNLYRHPETKDTYVIIERDIFLLHGEVEEDE